MHKLFLLVIRLYQVTLSPILRISLGKGCRFSPTCSEYAKEAFLRFGFFGGLSLSTRRFLRCHPWSGGGIDLVPNKIS